LHCASSEGDLEIVQLLVSAGGNIRAGCLPVNEALRNEGSDVVKYLLKGLFCGIGEEPLEYMLVPQTDKGRCGSSVIIS
jgi:hypothetical protein